MDVSALKGLEAEVTAGDPLVGQEQSVALAADGDRLGDQQPDRLPSRFVKDTSGASRS